ncbi:hypothetical protein CEE39_09765 [bacterium (candidate division B38) B3_B38]|nr:MAG: hypothetical protein CEE39_09765 [bacterium (candidate division B38) B3_B38]
MFELRPFGKVLIFAGIVFIFIGILILWGGKIPLLGKLPGDIHIKRDNFQFYFPLATCLLLSLLITIIIALLRR